jgi:hypothetical protein
MNSFFFLGQRVEYQDTQSPKVYRGTLIKYLCSDRYYAVLEECGKRWLVRRERLRHIGGCPRQGKHS